MTENRGEALRRRTAFTTGDHILRIPTEALERRPGLWALLLPFGLIFGLIVAERPMLGLATAASLLIVAYAFQAGARIALFFLAGYLTALATLPTAVLAIGEQTVPVALSDLLLVPLILAAAASPASALPAPAGLRSLGRRVALLNLAILVSILFLPLASTGPDLLGSILRFLRFLPSLILYAIVVRLAPDRSQVARLLSVVTAAISVQAVLGIISFLSQTPLLLAPDRRAEQLLWMGGEVLSRAQGTIAESSSLAHLAGIGCLLALFQLEFRRGLGLALALAAAAISGVCLVLTYSRGMTLSVIFGAALFFLLKRNGKRARLALAAVGLAAALVVLNAAGSPYLGFLWDRFASAPDSPTALSIDTYLSGRIGMWARLGEFLVENPAYIVFGIGYKTIAASGPFQGTVGDNNYFSMLIECGLFGLAALMSVLIGSIKGGWIVRSSPDPWYSSAGSLLISLWAMHAAFMLVGDAMTYWRSMPILFTVQFAVMLGAISRAPD